MDAAHVPTRQDAADAEEWIVANVLADVRGAARFFDALAADIESLSHAAPGKARSAAARSVARLRVFERLFEGLAYAYLHEPEGIVYRKLRSEGPQTAHQLLQACRAEAIGHRDLATIWPTMRSLLGAGIVERDGDLWRLNPRPPAARSDRPVTARPRSSSSRIVGQTER